MRLPGKATSLSPVEKILWRASLLVLGSSGILFSLRVFLKRRNADDSRMVFFEEKGAATQRIYVRALIVLCYFLDVMVTEYLSRLLFRPFFCTRRITHFRLGRNCAQIVAWALVVIVVSARAYIVVEAFLSLRSLPAEMYQTLEWPNWVSYL